MKDKIKQREMCAWELQGVRCSEAGPGSTFNEIIAEMCPSWKSREAADLVKLRISCLCLQGHSKIIGASHMPYLKGS